MSDNAHDIYFFIGLHFAEILNRDKIDLAVHTLVFQGNNRHLPRRNNAILMIEPPLVPKQEMKYRSNFQYFPVLKHVSEIFL